MDAPFQGIIGYTRTADRKLTIADQQNMIFAAAKQHGCQIFSIYDEKSFGRSAKWPELSRAIKHASQTNAALVVPRLGPLIHEVHLLEKLAKTNIPIIVAGGEPKPPDKIRFMALEARYKCDGISLQTSNAMIERKLFDGATYGTPRNLTAAARRKGARRSSLNRSLRAMQETIAAAKIALRMRSGGSTLQAIADHLNAEEHKTRRGRCWSRVQVKRVLDRLSMFKRLLDQNRAKIDMLCGGMSQQMGSPPMGGM
jgi:Resolvase, N terminal domain/Recombinase